MQLLSISASTQPTSASLIQRNCQVYCILNLHDRAPMSRPCQVTPFDPCGCCAALGLCKPELQPRRRPAGSHGGTRPVRAEHVLGTEHQQHPLGICKVQFPAQRLHGCGDHLHHKQSGRVLCTIFGESANAFVFFVICHHDASHFTRSQLPSETPPCDCPLIY